MAMSRWLCVVLCGLLVGLSWAGGENPPVTVEPSGSFHNPQAVGDPTGAFGKELEGVWGRGDPKAPNRVEVSFEWQKVGSRVAGLRKDGGPDWVKRPAIALVTYREGKVSKV